MHCRCGKMSSICSQPLPLINIIQKVYYLSKRDAISIVVESTLEQKLKVHIKLQNLETLQYLCLDPILLRELVIELRQLTKPNIDYPCAHRERQISVKPHYHENEFHIKNGGKTLKLAHDSVYELLNIENTLLDDVFNIEMECMYQINSHYFTSGRDTVF